MKYEIRLGSAEFKAVAVEIRRASWGAAIFSGVMANAYPDTAKYTYFIGALCWLLLQFVSMLIDSILVIGSIALDLVAYRLRER